MRPSNEALLISALVNSGDVTQAAAHGVEPEMMHGYQAEYRWLLNYYQTYGSSPSREALMHKFSAFPVTEATDYQLYSDEVIYGFQKRETVKVIKTAASYLAEDDLDEALLSIGGLSLAQKRTPLTNALYDDSFLANYDESIQAISMPWTTLQNVTGGARPGDYWTLAARYGHGKSWVLGTIIAHLLAAGEDVLFYSLEMPKEQVLTRVHVLLGAMLGFNVDHVAMRDRIYDPIQYRKILNSVRENIHGQLFVQDSGKVTSARIMGEARSAAVTVVDYIGLMYTNTGQPAIGDWRNMATISNQVKEAALATKSRIMVAAQINRDGDTSKKMPPRSRTLSQSDAIGQDSDVILMMKRYAMSAMAYTIDKNRHGADGISYFSNYQPNIGKFNEISMETAEDRRYEEDFTE
jgi:hypothetical protein